MNRTGWLWSTLVAIAALTILLVSQSSPGNQHAITLSIIYFFVFAFIWYLPHQCRSWNMSVEYLPATYFFSGSTLIILGCLSSTHLSRLHFNAEQWETVAEIMPLILGAVVGGTYCCDAILGQEFHGKPYRVGAIGTLFGALPLLLVLVMLRTGSLQPGVWLWMFGAMLSPALATFIIDMSIKKRLKGDSALWVFFTGVSLIFVTAFAAVWIFPKAKDPHVNTTFLALRDVVNILKNLVPSYCGAIGAGLITRGMEINVPEYSLLAWARENFGGFECISAVGNKVELRPKSPYRQGPIIEMTFEQADIDAMTSSSEIRRQYGNVLRDWLNTEWHSPSCRGISRVELDAPLADTLFKRRKTDHCG